MKRFSGAILILAMLIMTTLTACGSSTFYIKYELIGGTNSGENLASFTTEDLGFSLHGATKEGFVFDGWYTDKNYTQNITEITEAKSYRLYAKWVDAYGRVLTFDEEFLGDALDIEYWTAETGIGKNGWGNNEQQYYKQENATVAGGVLTITAKAESEGNKSYTSARLKTSGFAQAYGRFEAKIKLPAVQGLWPAFWLLPASDDNGVWPRSGEIDIMEGNGKLQDRTTAALHYSNGIVHNYKNFVNDNISGFDITDWHVYAVEWKNGEIKWYVDDVQIGVMYASSWNMAFSEGGDAPFNNEFYIIINLAVGGSYINNDLPPEGFTSAELQVDYIRVYNI